MKLLFVSLFFCLGQLVQPLYAQPGLAEKYSLEVIREEMSPNILVVIKSSKYNRAVDTIMSLDGSVKILSYDIPTLDSFAVVTETIYGWNEAKYVYYDFFVYDDAQKNYVVKSILLHHGTRNISNAAPRQYPPPGDKWRLANLQSEWDYRTEFKLLNLYELEYTELVGLNEETVEKTADLRVDKEVGFWDQIVLKSRKQ